MFIKTQKLYYEICFVDCIERSRGFTIPKNGCFYVFDFHAIVYFEIDTGKVIEIEDEWEYDLEKSVIILNGVKIPFIGFEGTPILEKQGVGKLELKNSSIKLIKEDGNVEVWNLENFSGDWEQVTFDSSRNAFLFGAPYDFDYRYITIP
ncbi:hypothetical protein [Aquimarina sp. Aq78]|uniref:hypothetical protein n=1 Tax=Aquimarina sp. Aq78 TaxID=1191889 RepID=UPI000D0EA656|nr:hypothetical protein [Aquimarina sp. Aq78]